MKFLLPILLLSILLVSCSKESETITQDTVKDLYPLSVGKVFVYRLDSTSLNLGKFSTAYYLEKDSVVSTFKDNLGRNGYVFYRYLTDTALSVPYHYADTYYAVVTDKRVEIVDSYNRRFVPLSNPVSFSNSWLGNSYLDYSQLSITANTNYDGWNYQYTSVNEPYTVLKGTFPNTYTVLQKADSSGVFNPSTINSKTYSVEVYAKGVGLIYKYFDDYFYQITPQPAYEDGSYSIKMNLVDYK